MNEKEIENIKKEIEHLKEVINAKEEVLLNLLSAEEDSEEQLKTEEDFDDK